MPRTKPIPFMSAALQIPDAPKDEAPKRAKTRPPASVRAKERRDKENLHQGEGSSIKAHTEPSITKVKKRAPEIPDYLAMLMDQLQSAIRTRNWDKLGDLIHGISSPTTGLNLPLLAEHPAVKKTLQESAIDVLTAGKPPTDDQICRALDLLSMGADWNATDEQGDSVLKILRTYADDDVRDFISNEFPIFRHLFIDSEGQPIRAA